MSCGYSYLANVLSSPESHTFPYSACDYFLSVEYYLPAITDFTFHCPTISSLHLAPPPTQYKIEP